MRSVLICQDLCVLQVLTLSEKALDAQAMVLAVLGRV